MGVGESAVMTSSRGSGRPGLHHPGAPLLAIVIDDWGYGWQAAIDFLSFDRPLTGSRFDPAGDLPLSALTPRKPTGGGIK